MCISCAQYSIAKKYVTYRPPDRPASIIDDEESTNDGVEDGPSIAIAASAEMTPAKIEAAAKLEANIFELLVLFDIDRDVVVERALLLTEVKAADELIDNAAATINRLDFILLCLLNYIMMPFDKVSDVERIPAY